METKKSKTKVKSIDKPLGSNEDQLVIELEKYSPTSAKSLLKTNDKISTALARNLLPDKENFVINEETGISSPVTKIVSLGYEGLEGIEIKGAKKFTSFDKEVLDAIGSLYLAGNRVISMSMIYRTMTGKQNSQTVTAKQLRDISESAEKVMFLNLKIGIEQELKPGLVVHEISGALLSAKKIKATLNGGVADAVLVNELPVLHNYSARYDRIASVELKVLDSPVNKSKEVIVAQGAIITLIENARFSKDNEVEILYDEMYDVTEIDKSDAKKTKRVRTNIITILEYWADEIHYIKDFREIKKGARIHSVKIKI